MSERRSHLSRRSFLLTIGATGAAAAATLVGRNPSPSRPATPADARRDARGYRESAHVARYYRSAQV